MKRRGFADLHLHLDGSLFLKTTAIQGVMLESEMEKPEDTFRLTDEHFKTLARSAARASFVPAQDKEWLLEQIAAL